MMLDNVIMSHVSYSMASPMSHKESRTFRVKNMIRGEGEKKENKCSMSHDVRIMTAGMYQESKCEVKNEEGS